MLARPSVGAKGGHLGAVPPLAAINVPPTTGHYFIYFPDNDRSSIHYPLYYTGLLMLWKSHGPVLERTNLTISLQPITAQNNLYVTALLSRYRTVHSSIKISD